MIKNKIINWAIYIISSIIGGLLLIVISESIRFSHINLLPFGGDSWAVWFHPFAFGISFGVLSKIFKIKKSIIIFLGTTIISIIIFYFLYNGLLFFNPIPFSFGIS